MARKIIRQGDVLLIEEAIPKAATLEKEHSVVMLGESGISYGLRHIHIFKDEENYFAQVYIPTDLKHPEHPNFNILVGTYRIASVRTRDAVNTLFLHPQGRTTPG